MITPKATLRKIVKKYSIVIWLIIVISLITVYTWSISTQAIFYHQSQVGKVHKFTESHKEYNEYRTESHKEYNEYSNSKNIATILWWTGLNPDFISVVHTCGIYKCRVTVDKSTLNNSDTKAIVFYGSDMTLYDYPLPRLNHHIWALLHEESPKNIPFIQHDYILNFFNYTSTFSRYSDFPITLQSIKDYESLRTLKYVVPIGEKSKLRKNIAPVAFLQSICQTMSGREVYVKTLMKYIPIDSYGTCLHNKKIPPSLKEDYLNTIDSDELYKFLARYKFIIAYENGVCNDYITEKFWRPLVIGSIPIYYGSPTIKDWLPNEKSAILISDFDSPKDLANFIKKLDENDYEYNKYLDHKYSQISPISNDVLKTTLLNRDYSSNNLHQSFECFLCKKIYNIKNNQYANKKHYDCGDKLVYPKVRKTFDSDWETMLRHSECQAKVLNRMLTNNRNYTKKDFVDELTKDIYNATCKI